MPRPRPFETFEIWQAKGRIASIDHPIRLEILRALEAGPKTLTDLAGQTKRSKSTLSTLHLGPLLKTGLVEESVDADDARVKWYRLEGARLGSSAVDKPKLRDAVLGFVNSSGMIPLRPLLDVLDLDALMDAASPSYLEGFARRLGTLFGRMLMAQTLAERANELDRIWATEGLGRLRLSSNRVTVKAENAKARRLLEIAARSALRLDEG